MKKKKVLLAFLGLLIFGLGFVVGQIRLFKSVSLKDICIESAKVGWGINWEKGYKHEEWYCSIVTGGSDQWETATGVGDIK